MKSRFWLLILLLPWLAGCWDLKELEDRALISGIAIDLKRGPAPGKEATEVEQIGGKPLAEHYLIGLQVINPVNANPSVEKGGPRGKGTLLTLITDDHSLPRALRNFSIRMAKTPELSQLQVLILGEEYARKEIDEVTDYLLRHPGVRHRTQVFVAKGEAWPLLQVDIPGTSSSGMVLARIPRREQETPGLVSLDLGQLAGLIHTRQPGVVSRVVLGEGGKSFKVAGAGVIKERRLVGWLGEAETKYYNLARGRVGGGVYDIIGPDGQIATLEVIDCEVQRQLLKGPPREMKMVIRVRANLISARSGKIHDLGQPGYFAGLEQAAQKQLARAVQKLIDKVQQQYGVDIFGFRDYLSVYHPIYWSSVEKDWDKLFKDMPVKVKVKVWLVRSANRP